MLDKIIEAKDLVAINKKYLAKERNKITLAKAKAIAPKPFIHPKE